MPANNEEALYYSLMVEKLLELCTTKHLVVSIKKNICGELSDKDLSGEALSCPDYKNELTWFHDEVVEMAEEIVCLSGRRPINNMFKIRYLYARLQKKVGSNLRYVEVNDDDVKKSKEYYIKNGPNVLGDMFKMPDVIYKEVKIFGDKVYKIRNPIG